MSDAICEKNIARYQDDSRFCLAQVANYDTGNRALQQKVEDLLDHRVTSSSSAKIERACNIGGCTLRITEGSENERQISGECKAQSYCLKTAFDIMEATPNIRERQALHGAIIRNCDPLVGQHSTGNFCPRLNCELTAGINKNTMAPEITGECAVQFNQD